MVGALIGAGTVVGAVPLAGPAAANTVVFPPGNTIVEPSFENGNSFTSGINRTVSRVVEPTSPDGSYSLRVTQNQVGSQFSVDNWPGSVSSTVANTTYLASAYVTTANPQTKLLGQWITLTVRQHKADGTQVATWVSPAAPITTSWQQLTVSATPTTSGDYLDVYVTAGSPYQSQVEFLLDAVSLAPASSDPTGLPVPSGYSAAHEVFRDTFGNQSGYALQNNWNFGLTDRPSGGWPWGGTPQPAAPYYGSGTHGDAQNGGCSPDGSIAEEYSLPNRWTQTSTGAAYNAFSATGTGLNLSIAPQSGTYLGCPYTWVSGALNTYNKHEFGGGGTKVFVEVRAKMPAAVVNGTRSANGMWGSIWMLPGASSTQSNSYEVDLMESGYLLSGVDPLRVVASNLHTAANQLKYDAGVDLSLGYHTYGAELNTATGRVDFYLDGVHKGGYDGGPTQPMFLLLNSHVADAGFSGISGWHTLPTTNTSAVMQVSGVRVFQKT